VARELWSQVFQLALRLRRYDQAYLALQGHPDADRRADALRRYVKVVAEDRQAARLVELPFVGLQAELASTLLFKARNALVTVHMQPNYYEVGSGHTGVGHGRIDMP
jgi:hypothetical protein